MKSDLAQIRRTWRLLYPAGGVIELRVIRGRASGVTSGFFDNPDSLVHAIQSLNGHAVGAYVTLNRVNPPLFARMANRAHWPGPSGAKDTDIPARDNLLFDFDAVRPSDISSTAVEHSAGIERARMALEWLQEAFGWPPGLVADSGNGGHLVFRIALPNEPWATELIKRVLRAVAAKFSDATVVVDESVHNASRITKLYGTWACKGDSTLDRPHRQATILSAPEALIEVTREQLEAVAAGAPAEPVARNTGNSRNVPFNIEGWMTENYIRFRPGVAYENGTKYVLYACPFDESHKAPDSAVFVLASGALVFKCLHNSCRSFGWRELRAKFERPIQHQADARHQTVREMRDAPKPSAQVVDHAELLQIKTETEEMLFDGFPLPARGAVLIIGGAKTGKTLLGIQAAISLARGKALFDYYSVVRQGPALIVEEDDPGGTASIAAVVRRSGSAAGTPLYAAEKTGLEFGPRLFEWLGEQFSRLKLRLAVLDSYTALRGSRKAGGDLVKVEQGELTQLDDLAKKCNGTIALIHHGSKGAAGLDWTQNAAGSYAIAAATESQIHIARFPEMDSGAERFVRIRGRHAADVQLVLRFVRDTLNYEWVMDGMASGMYPFLLQVRREFGAETFTMKTLCGATGLARATAYRYIERLRIADVIRRIGYGQYVLQGERYIQGDSETVDTAKSTSAGYDR